MLTVRYICKKLNTATKGLITANIISVGRVLQGIYALYLHAQGLWLASFLHLISSIYLDHIDGVWARENNQVTKLGAYLDRLGDKVFIIAACFYAITIIQNDDVAIPLWILIWFETVSVFITLSQMYITIFKSYLMIDGKAELVGKVKMVMECCIVIFIFLVDFKFNNNAILVLSLASYITVVLSGISNARHYHRIQNATS
jgi:phosphatidylglycerophosphate synthase